MIYLFDFFVVFARPDDTSQTGEKLCISFVVKFNRKAQRNYAKGRKAKAKGYIIFFKQLCIFFVHVAVKCIFGDYKSLKRAAWKTMALF
jgi:hypothetical protein